MKHFVRKEERDLQMHEIYVQQSISITGQYKSHLGRDESAHGSITLSVFQMCKKMCKYSYKTLRSKTEEEGMLGKIILEI